MADEHKTRLNSLETYAILDELGVLNERHIENYKAKQMQLSEIAHDMNPQAKAILLENLKKAVIPLNRLSKFRKIIVKRRGKLIKATDETGDLTAYMHKGKLYIEEYAPTGSK